MMWFVRFAIGSVVAVAVMMFIVWASMGFGALDLHGPVLIAFVFGVLGTAGLTIGLMALVFHSDRSEHDETVSSMDAKPEA